MHRISRIFHISQLTQERRRNRLEAVDIDSVRKNNNSNDKGKNRWSTHNIKKLFLQNHPSLNASAAIPQLQLRPCSPDSSGISQYNNSNSDDIGYSSRRSGQFVYSEKVEINDPHSPLDIWSHESNSDIHFIQHGHFYDGSSSHTSNSLYSTCSTSTSINTVEGRARRSLSSLTYESAFPTSVENVNTALSYQMPLQIAGSQRRKSPLMVITPPSSPTASLKKHIVYHENRDREEVGMQLASLVKDILSDAFELADGCPHVDSTF